MNMKKTYDELGTLCLKEVSERILMKWDKEDSFKQSIKERESRPRFTFYEGPPSANGTPGIHHVMGRTIKDTVCRHRTMKGNLVERKAGWDTHGLPVELNVEKELGITKDQIGTGIPIGHFNEECRLSVMRHRHKWDNLTKRMGYWVDMDEPYVTYDNKYIETAWWITRTLFDKGLLYKGHTIQPYSPAAGTGLSSHELNQPGAYRTVKDTSVTAQFKCPSLDDRLGGEVYLLAWTTTPWTLPSNSALAVGSDIDYVAVKTTNRYTGKEIIVVISRERLSHYFKEEVEIISELKGRDLVGIRYDQLMPYVTPQGKSFLVIPGDFVTTSSGTGIVHIAPTFGADDMRVAKMEGICPVTVIDEDGSQTPLVNKNGCFVKEVTDFAGEPVKKEYGSSDGHSVDEKIAILLKKTDRAFLVEKYEHEYPHCWRTDKPIIYYPMDSWFIRTTAVKERLIELNKTINWVPGHTGTGRFGNWLENLQDWNVSRSRYWGTPLPIWCSEDGQETVCIGSVQELYEECEKSVSAGFMNTNPLGGFNIGDFSKNNYESFDLHRPFVDDIILVSKTGRPMRRENDIIDVWFDSGIMPYAQHHYPFENKELIDFGSQFPADFIAEGVDQTRGWFFTLHVLSTMCFDSVAYRQVLSNGLVLDKDGRKMSKRLGNIVDPFKMMDTYGPDAVRWYMLYNTDPWENLKFDEKGIEEVTRKFFGTLHNTYGFFSTYANIDGYDSDVHIPNEGDFSGLDRWILSKCHSLMKSVDFSMMNLDLKGAVRNIHDFVVEDLSNWYLRLSRKRFWTNDMNPDKKAAYHTLSTCLDTVTRLMGPISPFYADCLYGAVNRTDKSVHLSDYPVYDEHMIDQDIETQMEIVREIVSTVHSIRKKEKIKVRQPLSRIVLTGPDIVQKVTILFKEVILSELNIKEIEFIDRESGYFQKKTTPNFKTLGPRYGKNMKEVAALVNNMSLTDLSVLEKTGMVKLMTEHVIYREDVLITVTDLPGMPTATSGDITLGLDTTITVDLYNEGLVRELISVIQKKRKDSGLDITDVITMIIGTDFVTMRRLSEYSDMIKSETLCQEITWGNPNTILEVELSEGTLVKIEIGKI